MARKTPEHQSVTARPERNMRDLLKELNGRNPCDLTALNEHELRRLEALCESWARLAEAEAGRRKMMPRRQARLSAADMAPNRI
jgi:hypothetical protein